MGKISNTLQLARAAWEVLKADKELTILPVLSFISSVVIAATFFVPSYLLFGDEPGPLAYAVLFVAYVALAYATIFFNAAIISAADERLQGGDPTVGSALRGAASRAGQILPWAVVSATVSLILRALEERAGILGRIVVGLAGLAWSLVTFLVVPVIVMEGLTVGDAIRRSAHLFKLTWGENVIARIGFGVLGFVAALPAILFIVLAVASGSGAVIAVVVGLAVLWMIAVAIVTSTLSGIFQAALYRYAADGTALGPFSEHSFATAFSPKVR